jgi:hypothetical protein
MLQGHASTTYSCVANDNCIYQVHILKSNGIGVHSDGFIDLYVTVTGSNPRPLILVLCSYEPIQWTLHLPDDFIIDRVVLSCSLRGSQIKGLAMPD